MKHLKGNSGDQIQKLASCQATRTKVAHAVVYAKMTVESDGDTFIHNNTPECQALWETATECIFELVDKADGRCGASLGGTLDYIPNPTLRLKKRRVFTFTSAFLRSTNVGIVCDPSIEFIINQP